MEQLIREGSLLAAVAAVTLAAYMILRQIGGTPTIQAGRILSAILGAVLLIGGLSKFFAPFSDKFVDLVTLSQLPMPQTTIITIHATEICAGIVLILFSYAWTTLRTGAFNPLFQVANAITIVIMLSLVYVNLHPDVPASILPLGIKPPIAALLLIVMAMMNMSAPRSNGAAGNGHGYVHSERTGRHNIGIHSVLS
ncbi:hypothetical protein SAMN06273572_1011068 [Monaibacterium marinum]|uniref:Uncharacterized protein n=1 Tax=Pontivivens marinum TaxID=1690039 RepID=A0A2C9CPR9_9RHOB|nr:hypothetical protein [Monaibacterium marinum]SOH93213.1 hypothetical protein SAMN06273572_1011068 [Monaibacterium marinum]